MREYEKVESMLRNYKKTQAEIKNIDLEIEEIKADYVGINPISYEEKGAPTNKFSSSVENEVIHREETLGEQIKYLERVKLSKINEIKKIDNALEILTHDEMNLVKLRYFDKLQFKQIGIRLTMNDTYCIQLKNKIINKLIPLLFIRNSLETT